MSVPHWYPAYVGIGSNLDSPEDRVRQALEALDELPESKLVGQSGLYRSAPLGMVEQPDFVNAVAGLLTQLGAHDLLRALQDIERKLGRKRGKERWGPRIIDLDLLAYSRFVLNDEGLELPHPGIAVRNFVLLPWQEIAPAFHVPGMDQVAQLAANISTSEPRIERIG